VEITVPSLLVPSLPNMEFQQPSEGAVGSCDPNVGNGSCKTLILVVMKLVESSNVGISMKGINYHKEVGVVRICTETVGIHIDMTGKS
jgi:hypothetical protein